MRSNGTVVSWGVYTNTPAGLSDIVAISAGYMHNLALRSDGTVIAWGSNMVGQTDVPAGLSNVVAISAGHYHSAALRADGEVFLWGVPNWGLTNLPGNLTNASLIAVGPDRNLAVRGDGSPFVTYHPISRTIYSGQSFKLSAIAGGIGTLSYQWLCNGLPVDGATNTSLLLTNTVSSQSGTYILSVSNALGVTFSKPAQVRILAIPPQIALQPRSFKTSLGTNITLTSSIYGPVPQFLQWTFNGIPIPGATNTSLILTNLGIANLGTYQMIASNAFGVTTSIVASVTRQWLFGWGALSEIPASASNIVSIAAGDSHNIALRTDGTVIAWGGTSSYETTPQLHVPSDLKDVIMIAAGGFHNLALSISGTVVAFGSNDSGQTNVPPDLTNVIAVAAGGLHSLALQSNGKIVAWGNNTAGQTDAPSDLDDAVAIAAGWNHNLALRRNGTVIAWGEDSYGQTDVPAGLKNVVGIAAGYTHSLALCSDGRIVAWGNNSYSQATVPSGLSNIIAVVSGPSSHYNFALRADGTIAGFGAFALYGKNILSGLTNVTAVAAGSSHLLALIGDGKPFITSQPWTRKLGTTDPIGLQIVAGGNQLNIQWYSNNVPLVDGTNSMLRFTDPAESGTYYATVSNSRGSVVSSNCVIVVRPPQRIVSCERLQTGGFALRFGDADGGTMAPEQAPSFRVLVSDDMNSWRVLNNELTVTNGLLMIQDPDSSSGRRFYRVTEK